jgi:prepilin-type processing-associated H-X9-DG protein
MESHLIPPDDLDIKQPPIPLNAGHIGLLCISGYMNGIFGEGERRHSARWSSSKVTLNVPQTQEDKEKEQVRTTERFDTYVNVLFADGRYQSLSQNGAVTDSAAVEADCAESEPEDEDEFLSEDEEEVEEEEVYG